MGLEDSTAPYEFAKRMNLVDVGRLGQHQHLKDTTKKGSWSTLPTWPTFFVRFAGTSGLELVGLEDSTAPYEIAKRMNLFDVGRLGQHQHLKNTTKKGSWSTMPTLPTFFVRFGGDVRIGIGGPRRLDGTLHLTGDVIRVPKLRNWRLPRSAARSRRYRSCTIVAQDLRL